MAGIEPTEVKLVPLNRPRLPSRAERALIDFLLAGPGGTPELQEQAKLARVTAACTCGCPSVGLEVGANAPRLPSGPTWEIRARGANEARIEVEVTLHVVLGGLAELEIWAGEYGPVDPPPVIGLRYDEQP